MRTLRGGAVDRATVRLAALVGIAAAAAGHSLDRAGQLPFVHEQADIRTAMSPWMIACWLLLAAALSALAAATRPTLLGAPAAVVVSAVPEIIGRHDFGAMAEPGAMAGALVQWLLIGLVVALALVAQRQLAARRPIPVAVAIRWPAPAPSVTTPRSLLYAGGIRSRAPPRWSSNP